MNELNLTPLQQQRYDNAQEEYWKEPNCAMNRHKPHFIEECTLFATWAARANVMSDDEFKTITNGLFQLGLECGDVGGEFYARILRNLQALRRSPL